MQIIFGAAIMSVVWLGSLHTSSLAHHSHSAVSFKMKGKCPCSVKPPSMSEEVAFPRPTHHIIIRCVQPGSPAKKPGWGIPFLILYWVELSDETYRKRKQQDSSGKNIGFWLKSSLAQSHGELWGMHCPSAKLGAKALTRPASDPLAVGHILMAR